MGSRKLLLLVMILGLSQISRAQSPTYGVGRTPTAEEIRKWDISIGPDGKELPPGQRNRRARRGTLCSQGLLWMPWGNRFRGPGSYFDQERRQDQVPLSLPQRLA